MKFLGLKLYLAILAVVFSNIGFSKNDPEENQLRYDYYSESFQDKIYDSGGKLALVMSGWSDSALVKMHRKSSKVKQHRGFALAYLTALKLFQEAREAHVFYLSTAPVNKDFRRYLFKLSTGDPSFRAFAEFESAYFTNILFAIPKKGSEKIRLEDYYTSRNNSKLKNIASRLVQLKENGFQIVGLAVHSSCEFLQHFAAKINLPLIALKHELSPLRSKSAGRKLYKELNIQHPEGTYRPLFDIQELCTEIYNLLFKGHSKFIVKIDHSSAGNGNLIIDLKNKAQDKKFFFPEHRLQSLRYIESKFSNISDAYRRRIKDSGAIIEEYIEGKDKSSPAILMNINHDEPAHTYYIYDQILLGRNLQRYEGSRGPFPDQDNQLHNLSAAIGERLKSFGVRGNVGIDYLIKNDPANGSEIYAIENNLRNTGTFYIYNCARALIGEERLSHSSVVSADRVRLPGLFTKGKNSALASKFFTLG